MSAALVAMSCAKELTDNQEAAGNDNVVYKTITFESVATKTTLDETTGAVAWEEGDQISIYYIDAEGKAAEAVATTQSAGASAVFTAQIPEADNPTEYYAAYPKGSGRLTIKETTDEATQEATKTVSFAVYIAPHKCDGTFKSANYAAAYTVAGDAMALAFKNAVGLVKVTLPEGGVFKHDGKDYKVSGVYLRGINGADTNIGNMPVVIEDNAITGFGTPDGVKNIPLENLSKAAIEAGYAYLPTAPCNWTNGICVRYLSADATIPAVLSQEKSISIERGHVLSLPDVSSMVVFDYYVSTDGEGDGTSSDKPMNITKMQEMFTAGGATMAACYKLDGTTFHLADGTYELPSTFTIPASSNSTVYTVTIEGDNAKAILDGGSKATVIKVGQYIHLNLKGLKIANGKASKGAGLYLDWTDKATDEKCIVDCKGCHFLNNDATNLSAALFADDAAAGGLARFDACYFESNGYSASKGSVLATNGNTAFMFNKCYFRDNAGPSQSSIKASNGIIFNVGSSKIFNTRLALNNCTINSGNFKAASNGAAVTSTGYTVISNSTLWASSYIGKRGMIASGASTTLGHTNASTVVNCFVKNKNNYSSTNNETKYPAFWLYGTYYQNIQYCIYAGHLENGGATSVDNPTYFVSNSYSCLDSDITDKSEVTATIDGVELKSYTWTWVDNFKNNYTCPTLQQVKDAINATPEIGPKFLAWLETIDGAFTTDILGRARDINAMCPGSYQQAGTPSGN